MLRGLVEILCCSNSHYASCILLLKYVEMKLSCKLASNDLIHFSAWKTSLGMGLVLANTEQCQNYGDICRNCGQVTKLLLHLL